MSVEIHDKLIALLGEVDELKSGRRDSNRKSSATSISSRRPIVK